MKKIGWQTYPTSRALYALRKYPPPILKILDPQLDLPLAHALTLEARQRWIPTIWRFVGFFDDRDPARLQASGVDPAKAAAQHAAELLSNLSLFAVKPDYVEIFNEPSTDPRVMEWLRRYYNAAIPIWAEFGMQIIGFNFSSGTPEGNVPSIPGLIYGAHEYAQNGDPQSPHHWRRYPRWLPAGARLILTEIGFEPRGQGFSLDLLRQYDERLALDKNVLFAAYFLLDSPFDEWKPYMLPDELLPAFQREPTSPMAPEIVRGIDVSAYSRAISPFDLRLLRVQHGIQVVVIQVAGGTPCGRALNPFALQQASAAKEAEIPFIGLYLFPPRAILDKEIQAYLVAIQLVAKNISFLALDVEAGEGVTREHIDAVRSLGLRPVIYTSPAAWASIMGNTSAFADVPLWEANYPRKFRDLLGRWNGKWPTLEDKPWVPVTRGGWRTSPAWQFASNVRLEGILCDLNVFEPHFLMEGGKP